MFKELYVSELNLHMAEFFYVKVSFKNLLHFWKHASIKLHEKERVIKEHSHLLERVLTVNFKTTCSLIIQTFFISVSNPYQNSPTYCSGL